MGRDGYSLSAVPGLKGDAPPFWNYTYIISFKGEGKVKLMSFHDQGWSDFSHMYKVFTSFTSLEDAEHEKQSIFLN